MNMKYVSLEREGAVFVLSMINGEEGNSFNNDVLFVFHDALDEIEECPGNASLIITSNHSKNWCNGVNTDWFFKQSPVTRERFITEMSQLFLRIALLGLPTIACISGNCYGAGAMLATTMDFRFMRSDYGRFCFPEVNVNIAFDPVAAKIVKLIPNQHALKEMILTGVAWDGETCLSKNVVDEIYSAEKLAQKSLEFGKVMAEKNRKIYTSLKHSLKKHLLA